MVPEQLDIHVQNYKLIVNNHRHKQKIKSINVLRENIKSLWPCVKQEFLRFDTNAQSLKKKKE